MVLRNRFIRENPSSVGQDIPILKFLPDFCNGLKELSEVKEINSSIRSHKKY
ncbi:hypothetical protein VUJ46_20300 [Chryseobacterium sp. MYb264]|uniref:hypothetical protein n=1 Tax=Chryseobacterium sp. MYb264 TaxID=2745153 RepID=UPI002E12F228|nr:hypothetical protein VUJ46_20300 [Chryseobacterium sp. MYb264]